MHPERRATTDSPALDLPPVGGKVNVLILTSSLGIGGSETVIRHLAQTIDRRRFNVTVCYLKFRGLIGDELVKAGIDIVGVSDGPHHGVDYLTFLKVLRIIRTKQISVVHTHNVDGLVDAALCKLLRPRLRLVHTFHFGNYPHARRRLLWMERIFSKCADRLFSVGDVQREQIRAVYRFGDRAIRTIRNGVKLPARPPDTSFRARIGAGNRIVIGTIATFIEQKGLRDLLQVAAKVRNAGHDARFVIVGEGRLRRELEALRHELGLDDVVAMPGWVTNAAELTLPAFDVFFQPSLWEAMSVVILESMAAGKAIVATRVGENPHIIEDGVEGLLVEPKDVDGMAYALGQLIGNADLRRRLGSAARRKVEQRFTVEHMTRAYEEVYLETGR